MHTCVSKSRFITFKVKEDVRALLGGTCTYKQEPSLKPIADRVFYFYHHVSSRGRKVRRLLRLK